MIEEHQFIIESDMPITEKLSKLYLICEHLHKVLDEYTDSNRDFTFVKGLIGRRQAEGFYLKLDQMGDEYKATFWKPDGDGVKTFSHTDKDFVRAIEQAGTKPESLKIQEMIRKYNVPTLESKST